MEKASEFEMKEDTFIIPFTMTVRELLERWLPIQASKHKWAPKTYVATNAHIHKAFPGKQECSASSLILKPTKTPKSALAIFIMEPLKQELKVWLAKRERDWTDTGERYRESGMQFCPMT